MTTTAPQLGFWPIAEANPDHLAVVTPDERLITNAEMLAACNQVVHGFQALGRITLGTLIFQAIHEHVPLR